MSKYHQSHCSFTDSYTLMSPPPGFTGGHKASFALCTICRNYCLDSRPESSGRRVQGSEHPLGLLWLVKPIKFKDVGKIQTRFMERAVGVEILGSWIREH